MKSWLTRYECSADPSCGVWTHVEVSLWDDEPYGLGIAHCPECGALMFATGPALLVDEHPAASAN